MILVRFITVNLNFLFHFPFLIEWVGTTVTIVLTIASLQPNPLFLPLYVLLLRRGLSRYYKDVVLSKRHSFPLPPPPPTQNKKKWSTDMATSESSKILRNDTSWTQMLINRTDVSSSYSRICLLRNSMILYHILSIRYTIITSRYEHSIN